MKRGSRKSPLQLQREHKTPDQVQKEFLITQKRAFIKDKFYPALEAATVSADEASQLLSAIVALIMEEAMEKLRTTEMEEIRGRLVAKLCSDDQRILQIEKLVDSFKGMTLFEARGHCESMKAVISQMTIDEMRNRTLTSLNVQWDRYLS